MELLCIGSLTTPCLYGGYLVSSSMWGCLCNANWRDEAVTLPHLLSAHYVFILSSRRPSRQALLGFVVACFVTWWRSRAVYLHICCKHLCSVMHCELYQMTHFPWWTERCKSRVFFFFLRDHKAPFSHVSRRLRPLDGRVNWWKHLHLAPCKHNRSSLGDRLMPTVWIHGHEHPSKLPDFSC